MADSYNELFGLGSHSPDASLEGWWPLQDDAASATVTDYSGNSRNGTAAANTSTKTTSGPSSSGGYLDKALSFNGSSDKVTISDNAAFTHGDGTSDTAFSSYAKIYRTATGSAGAVLAKASNIAVGENYLFVSSADSVFLRAVDDSTGGYISRQTFGTALSATTWYAVGGTYTGAGDSTWFDVLIDGSVLDDTTTDSGSYTAMEDTAEPLTIGSRGSTLYFNGRICEVSHWSRQLSTAEVQEIDAGPEPINTVAPVISGTQTEGQTLSVTSGTWGLDTPFNGKTNHAVLGSIQYNYQWTRSDDSGGTGEANISGATSNTYTLQAADIGKYIRCVVRGTNDGGFDVAADTNSNMSGAISAAGGSPVSLTAGVGAGTGAGNAPAIMAGVEPSAGAGSGTGAGGQPSLSIGSILTAGVGSGSGSGNAPTLNVGGAVLLSAGAGSGSGAGQQPSVILGSVLSPGRGSGTGSGSQPSLELGAFISLFSGSGTGSGKQPSVNTGSTATSPRRPNLFLSGGFFLGS